jgi:hypothetical protein
VAAVAEKYNGSRKEMTTLVENLFATVNDVDEAMGIVQSGVRASMYLCASGRQLTLPNTPSSFPSPPF